MLFGTKKKLVFGLTVILLVLSLSGGCPFRKETPEVEVKPEAEDEELKEDMIARPVLQPKLKTEREKHPDAVAWIYVPGTNIDYPVMKSEKKDKSDAYPYYYRRAENGEQRRSGSIWTLMACNFASRKTLSRNTVVAGHHMEKGTDKDYDVRLAQLEKFYEINFAHEHPYVFFSIPGEDMVFEVFAVYIAEVPGRDPKVKGFPYYTSYFLPDGKEYKECRGGDGSLPAVVNEEGLSCIQKIAREAKLRSLYNYETKVGKDSKIITLTTCTYKYGKTGSKNCDVIEFVVQGKLLSTSKKLYDKARFFSKNENPKPPQDLPNPNVDYVYMAEGELIDEPAEASDKELEPSSRESDDKKK
ncbi:hypothetical protein FACS1894198_4130 [Clostridia bacterium]|nr:hypothetical protein FACS1894198_4130 [Clostridia bacterium]